MNKRITFTVAMLLLTASTGLANLTDGLVAYYLFDGNANDLSGNANHGVVYGAQLTVDRFGRADHAYLFDGLDDTIEAPHSASLDITGPITVSCWVKAHDTYWRSGLVIKAPDYDPSVGYHLRTVYDKAHFGLYYSAGSTHKGGGAASDTLVNDNVWHLVTGTYNGSEIRMYVDGQLETLTPYSIGYESNMAALQIGHYYYPYSDLWGPGHEGRNNVTLNGAIDEVRIYNRALDQSEITELYNEEPEPPGTTLSGVVYEDKDGDMQYTPGEGEEIVGAVVSTGLWTTSTTDSNGLYLFTDLIPGFMRLEVSIGGELYHVEPMYLYEGKNTRNIAVQVTVISEAYECADADTVCLLAMAGLVPLIGIEAQLVSLGNSICEIGQLADNNDIDGAYSKGVQTLVSTLASKLPVVNVVFAAIDCYEAQMSERYENGLTPEDLEILARGLSDGSIVIVTMSPVDICVLNSSGNVMELNSEGLTENQLGYPGWIFTFGDHRELAMILDGDDDYVVNIVGRPEAGAGSTFGLQLMRKTSGGSQSMFLYTNVPITSQGTATVGISDGIKPILEVDIDGDGSIDLNLLPDSLAVEVIPQLPPSKRNNPGRTVPVKFSALKPERVDPAMPFVHDEDLEIRIYDSAQPGIILQASTYGDTSADYRICDVDELYITNFKTKKEAAEYTVEIWRPNVPFMVGSFSFQTIATHANQETTNDTGDDKGIDVEEAVTFMLFEVGEIINKLGPKSFKNEESAIELADEIEAVFSMLDEGLLVEALDVLENDILQRTDGCVNNGEPDEDDWVTSRKGQALVYPLVTETIGLLESLI